MDQILGTDIRCFQLKKDSRIPADWYSSISELIYDTDPYIYPALFGRGPEGKEIASGILPAVFETNEDEMFSKSNLFLAAVREELVGLILWHRGPLRWDAGVLQRCAVDLGIELIGDNIEQVAREYVADRYLEENDAENRSVYLINVCVAEEKRGSGIASAMLKSFIARNCKERMELAVLAENKPAVSLYRKCGFRITQKSEGFSLDAQKPPCFTMVRPIKNTVCK